MSHIYYTSLITQILLLRCLSNPVCLIMNQGYLHSEVSQAARSSCWLTLFFTSNAFFQPIVSAA